ncbi:unnamed protein product [Nippostrongylus brasiliensis]|uniref:Alginate_lyase domain-containing protein n=1 Tax=Nippostrongylus brasiliensis TaxID=27835 RepID=A0A0N4YBL5_NIPBR|nr:unnamed protein product [Nippostrongylus brasiliensis]
MRWVALLLPLCYSCASEDALNTEGYKIASDLLTKSINFSQRSVIWPMLHGDDKWQPKDYNLTALMKLMSARAVHAFASFDATPDERNVSRRILRVNSVTKD